MKNTRRHSADQRRHGLNRWTKIGLIVGAVAIVGFLTWLAIRVLTMGVELATATSFVLPEFKSLASIRGVSSSYAVAVDGEVVAEGAGAEVRPTASTAKMILGLAVMREKPFELGTSGAEIVIDSEMYGRYVYYVNNGGSYTAVQEGEGISEYDALMSVFLASSNNMADSLAIWAFGSLENYREYAHQMLTEWGMSETVLGSDASGFDPATVSTANELARIGTKVLENPVLREIVGTKEYVVPVAGILSNTNKILGRSGVVGVKTGWIGDVSGYCLISGYFEGKHPVTVALLGAATRENSFAESLEIIDGMQDAVAETQVIRSGDIVGNYKGWWTDMVPIRAKEDLSVVGWEEAETQVALEMNDREGLLKIKIGNYDYTVTVAADDYEAEPSLLDKIRHAFGWQKGTSEQSMLNVDLGEENAERRVEELSEPQTAEESSKSKLDLEPATAIASDNCTIKYGYLMLINPNFTVTTDFIDARRNELVSISSLYGIVEGNPYNGDNLLDAEAAAHLNEMVKAYETEYPGHTFETRSCYRARGTTCGRLCAATGASDHHTGLTCDLLDPAYGDSLDTDTYAQHIDWQWLHANSYKYGFIDRFPEAWAGGPMSEPLNVDENGSTGLFETWHYRYVGVEPAAEIATGKYNNGEYDSLEHYLKARGLIRDLKLGTCE